MPECISETSSATPTSTPSTETDLSSLVLQVTTQADNLLSARLTNKLKTMRGNLNEAQKAQCVHTFLANNVGKNAKEATVVSSVSSEIIDFLNANPDLKPADITITNGNSLRCATGSIQTLLTNVTAYMDSHTQQNQVDTLETQSLSSKRDIFMNLGSNLLHSVNEAKQKVVANIGR